MWSGLENKGKWVLVGSMFSFFVSAIAGPSSGYQSDALANRPLESMDYQELQEEKLRQEIRKLQLEDEKIDSPWETIKSSSPFIMALVALMGVFITIWKQLHESNRQRGLDRNQRETDSLRRLDEKFASIVTDLGSESPALQASAAVSIMSFLKPEYKSFHEQVFFVLLANLKIQQSETIGKLLITAFDKAIRRYLEYAQEKDKKVTLDLSHAFLHRVDLSGLDISQADLGFAKLRSANLTNANLHRILGMEAKLNKARLSRANLNEARLRKAQFQKAQFHEANLVAADFEQTDLTGAQFQRAKMQAAHLNNAKLRGAKFEQANLADTYFNGASLDLQALKSIINAKKWQKAHFDPDVAAKLAELDKNRG